MVDNAIVSFIKSTQGNLMLIHSGYVYRLKKSTAKVKYWSCISKSCAAVVHTRANNGFIKAGGRHQHLPAPDRIEVRNLNSKAKQTVLNGTTVVPKVYEEELLSSNLSEVALAIAPSPTNGKSDLNRVRRYKTPPIPMSTDFRVPDHFQRTFNEKQYLCSDRFLRNKRLMLFATDKQLQMLFSSDWIFLDGTFESCPAQFKQIYTIHCLKFQQNFPCAIALLSGKSTDIYLSLFSELEYHAERLKLVFNPQHITTDFEPSLIKAVKQKFPMAQQHASYFHFCQALYKQIQQLGLSSAYLNDENIRLACRSTMTLPLLPLHLIEQAMEVLEYDTPPKMRAFFEYFRYQWLTRVPPKYWTAPMLDFHTNNICESWHNKFNHRVDKTHSSLWHLIECFQRQELLFRQQLVKLNCGIEKKNSENVDSTRFQIETLADRYCRQEITILEFIHGLSNLIVQHSLTVH